MSQGRQWVRGAFVAAATVAFGLGVMPAAAHASGGPAITLTPNSGLVSGQTVTVKGSGFAAKDTIVGVECPNGTTDPTQCDISSGDLITANAKGGFNTTFAVHESLLIETGFVDCGAPGCELLFASASDFTDQATAPLAFDPSVAPPAPTVRLTPATKLANQESVAVHGTGFIAGDDIEVTECLNAPFTCGPETDAIAGATGKIVTDLSVDRILGDEEGDRIDCASTPSTCAIVAFDAVNIDYHASAPLKFDPSLPPPPPPTLKVAPSHKLPFYARVTVRGKNWDSDEPVFLLQCSDITLELCANPNFAQTDSAGAFTSAPMLQRELVDPLNPESPPFDCAAPGAHCILVAQGSAGDGEVTAALSFDRTAPIPPPPSATLTPAAPYRNNQTVHVNGTDFAPNAAFELTECATKADSGACIIAETEPQLTDATGSLSTTFQLERRLDGGPGSNFDCLASGVVCTLQVSSEGGAEVDLPLTFTAGASASASAASMPGGRVVTHQLTGWAANVRPAACALAGRTFRMARANSASLRLDAAGVDVGRVAGSRPTRSVPDGSGLIDQVD